MTQNPAARTRPGGVTAVVVLVIISGVFALLGGIAAILARNNVTVSGSTQSSTSSALVAIGVVGIVLGLIYLAVARGLSRGSNGARILVTVVAIIQLLSAAYGFVAGGNRGTGSLGIILPLLIVVFLNTGYAREFFTGRR